MLIKSKMSVLQIKVKMYNQTAVIKSKIYKLKFNFIKFHFIVWNLVYLKKKNVVKNNFCIIYRRFWTKNNHVTLVYENSLSIRKGGRQSYHCYYMNKYWSFTIKFSVTGKFLLRKFHLGKFHLENSSYGKFLLRCFGAGSLRSR